MNALKGKEEVQPATATNEKNGDTQANQGGALPIEKADSSLTKTGRIIKIRKAAESKELYKDQFKEVETEDLMTHLPRGGTIVTTVVGDIQFGIPPDTIKVSSNSPGRESACAHCLKDLLLTSLFSLPLFFRQKQDSLKMGKSPPTYFVILGEMFDRQAGLNMAEFEFPAYFNFFCLKKKVTLICMPELEARVRAIFTETLLGPQDELCRPKDDHGGDRDDTAYPRFREEGYYLDGMRRTLSVDTLVNFMTFDARQEVTIDDKIKIKYDMFTKSFRVIDVPSRNKEIAKIIEKFTYVQAEEDPDEAEAKRNLSVPIEEPAPFDLPKFGITILGNSHGFDVNGTTTGFVIWINGRGLMVDPPPLSTHALEKLSIPPRLIEGIILTHCHADHDAGTFQKMLKEQSVKIYTTQTIFDSFMRKYAAISGFGKEFLCQLLTHQPVKIGEPTHFHGAQFNFYYSFHTIPCIGFEVLFEGESMVYSADTNSDPALIEKMFAEGAIGQQRRDMLIEKSPLRGEHSLIFHEAGVPPIHTPMKLLVDLEDWIKEKMFIVHVTGSQIPQGSGLKQAAVFDTLVIEMDQLDEVDAITRFMESIEIFGGIGKDQLSELAKSSEKKVYERGSTISVLGTEVKVLTIFTSGLAIEREESSGKLNRKYKPGDWTGENALVEDGCKTLFTITASTRVHTVEIPMSVVQPFVVDEKILSDIRAYAPLQSDGTWTAISQNMILKDLTNVQRTHFLNALEAPESYSTGNSIDIQSCGVLVMLGEVQVLLDPSSVEDEDDLSTYRGKNRGIDFIDSTVSVGSFLSDINTVLNDKITYVTCEALSDVKIRRLPRTKLIQFLIQYPGLMVQLLDTRILSISEVI